VASSTVSIDAGAVRLAALEAGDRARPTVVLVHGYPDTKDVWADVVPRLAERFHVVAYDVRGAGGSTAPARTSAYDLDRLTDDVLAVLDEVSPGRPAHLVGHDWGSIQGWEFATSPRLVGRLASYTSISGPSLDHVGMWMRDRLRHPTPRHLRALAGQGLKSWYIGMFQTPVLPALAWRTVLPRRLPKVLARLEGVTARPAPTLASDGRHGMKLYKRNMPRRLRRPRPDAVAHVPVQLVVPTRDPFVSPRLYEDLDRWTPVLRRRQIDAGHWVPRTEPETLARWIGEFVDDVEGGDMPEAHGAADDGRAFAGRLVLVTGAGSGIGRATALSFAEGGATVLAVDIDPSAAARTAELVDLVGGVGHALSADVSDVEAMEHLAKTVAEDHGVVDVLVNNAGIGLAGDFLDTTVEDWRRVLDVNLWGVIHGCRLFGRQMVERGQGGHIVNVASAAGIQPSKGLPAYSTSKAAVLMLSECLRADFAGAGIGVTAVCPGFINTNITRTTRFVGQTAEDDARMRARASDLYRRRGFGPERVADEILRAVRENRAVVPVAPEAKLAVALARFAPRLRRFVARAGGLPT
jgi:NAD(P)-dependent dehydrogenase (short-subunit alcohol dehydrogenase family)/pimeloyl-ACP methyl ester carboxylesterase